MASKEAIQVSLMIEEAKCKGYECCLQDIVKQLEKLQDLDPIRAREELRRFIKIHKEPST